MAFRSSASATGTGTGTITATPAGVQAHDYLGGWWLADGSATPTLTPPSGWTQRASVHVTLDGQTQFYADKNDATGSDAFGFADDAAANDKALITAAWSGRNNSAPRSATPVTTGNSASNTSPISATITGITAVNGDDIGIGLGTDEDTAGARWTESTIASYTQQVNGVAQDWVSGAGLQTRDNVSAGATGNFAVTITRTAGLGNSGYCGIVVAIAAAAASADTSRPGSVPFRPGGSMGPRMRRALPQRYPDSPVTPVEWTQTPAAPIPTISLGPRRRRSIPQQYADTPVIPVELTQSPAAPFRPGRGPGMGPMSLHRNFARPSLPDATASPDVTVALTGVQGTGSVGTLGVQLDVALTGNAAMGSVGTLTPGTTLALTGVSCTGSVGTLAPATAVAMTGVAGTGAVGTLAPTNTVTLTGNEATVTIGTLTPDVAGDVTIALTGVSASALVGNLSPSGADVPAADTGAGRGSDDAPRRRRRYIFPDGTQVLATPNEALGLLEQFARMRKPQTDPEKSRQRRPTFVRIPPAELESIVQWKQAADTAEELIQPVLSLNIVFTPDQKQFAQAIARLKRKIDDEEAIFALMM